MCKIYEFPKPIVLPEHLKDRLKDSAKGYVLILNDILHYFEDENFNDEELLKVMDIMLATYLETIEETVDNL